MLDPEFQKELKAAGITVDQFLKMTPRQRLDAGFGKGDWREGWMSFQVIAPDRSKTTSNNPRNPVGQPNCCFGTYTVDDVAKTVTFHIERCTFPQWDGADRTLNVAFPTENDLNVTPTKPIQDPSFGPFPRLSFKRAM